MSESVAGSIVAKLGYDTTGLRKGESEASASLSRVDEKMALTSRSAGQAHGGLSQVGTALGALAGYKIGSAVVDSLGDMISKASDLNETLSKSRTVFGDSFGLVDTFAKGAAKSVGESRQAAEEAAATFGNLFTGIGIGQDTAAKMSTTLIQLAGDLASFNNTSTGDALDALKSGLVGEVEPLRRYGVALDDATLRQEALKLGLVSSTRDALQPAVRSQAAYAAILERTKTAQGDFARTSDGLANSQRTMRAQVDDAKAALGQGLLPLQLELVKVGSDLAPVLTQVAEAIGALGEHGNVVRTLEVVGGIAVALVAVNKAIVIGKAVRDSELATLIRGTAAREASTAAIVAEGRAATATAGELEALRVAESTPGAAVRGPSRLGAIGGPTLAVTAGLLLAQGAQGPEQAIVNDGKNRGGAVGGAESGFGKVLQFTNGVTILESAWNAFKAKPKQDRPDDKPTPMPAVTVTPDTLTGTGRTADRLAASRSQLDAVIKSGLDPKARQSEASLIGGAVGGLYDEAAPTTAGNVKQAEQDVTAAREKVLTSTERVGEAQRKLNDLRRSGHATATQLATAEDRLADARRNLDRAGSDLHGKQTAAHEAAAPPGLSVQDVLGRGQASVKNAQGLEASQQKLVEAGVNKPTLEKLDQLEKQVPGTLARVAGSITPALAKQFNSQNYAMQKAYQDFLEGPRLAAQKAATAKVAADAAAYARAVKNAYVNALGDDGTGAPEGHRQPNAAPGAAPVDHEGRAGSVTKHYDLRGSTIVASNPRELEQGLEERGRLKEIGGGV